MFINNKRKPRRGTRSPSRNKPSQWLRYLSTIGIPLVMIGVFVMAFQQYINRDSFGPDENYCYVREDQNQSAIFIDNSITQHSDSQLRDIRTALTDSFHEAEPNTSLLVFTTASDTNGSIARPVFTICKPPTTPAELEAINAPSKTAPFLERQYNEAADKYSKAVDQILLDVQNPELAAKDSPILEQIRAISKYSGFHGQNRGFIIITDGIQNSSLARFGVVKNAMPPFAGFKDRLDYEMSIQPRSLDGVEVRLLLIEFGKLPSISLPYVTNNEIKVWYYDYFKGNGAASVDITSLRYWGAR